ncbi:hypothetical protein [Arundinibacter roseus]|uniref:Outer membrane protein beta-barrel domain-containing protein n=1 Tax=Arundinibacter roseus TaxID=2070510 RepID=A0A4R4K4Q9_9BACT|nr:hypothetical protein [Arundinibacter roseus]TDB62380.1 hypothetical protein EZE20_18535 [Arundinibacter roseus]
MRKLSIFTIGVLLLISGASFGQELAGRKILNGSFYTQFNSNDQISHSRLALSSNLLLGKIKEDNSYWAFGGSVYVQSEDAPDFNINTNRFGIGPAVERGKFVRIIDKLYIAPYAGGSVQGVFGDVTGANLSVYASPLRFMYQLTNHFLVSASFGSATLEASRIEKTTQITVNASFQNNTGFGVFYTFK